MSISSPPSVNDKLPLDLVWGVPAIASQIGRTERQTFHMLATGAIPPARKIGGRWVISKKLLEEFFTG